MNAIATTAKNPRVTIVVREHGVPKHKKSWARRRAKKACKRIEASIHYSVALVLLVIAAAMLIETVWSLITTSSPFVIAVSSAVGGVLFVLILVEMTRTVLTSPDTHGNAICRLLVIGIVGALREVLWIGVNPSLGGGGDDASSHMLNRPLDLAVDTAVVIGLAVAFALVRRVSVTK